MNWDVYVFKNVIYGTKPAKLGGFGAIYCINKQVIGHSMATVQPQTDRQKTGFV